MRMSFAFCTILFAAMLATACEDSQADNPQNTTSATTQTSPTSKEEVAVVGVDITLGEHATALRQEAETIAYATYNVIGTPRRFDANTRRSVHLKLLARALKAGVRVRDCLMCVHARPNFRLEKARPLWCGAHACAIPHSEATSCPDYAPPTGREP